MWKKDYIYEKKVITIFIIMQLIGEKRKKKKIDLSNFAKERVPNYEN